MELPDEWRESDRARRRKSDVQEKFYNFLNRSAQSLTRSNSQKGTRRAKDKETNDIDCDVPRAPHAAASRQPVLPSSAGKTAAKYASIRSTHTHRTAGSLKIPTEQYKSSSPPVSPGSRHRHHPVPYSSQPNATIAYSYNTPPQTPSRSRNPSFPSSPSSPTSGRGASGADLLLNRPLARPITPSNSSSAGRKVLGILLPSPKFKKATLAEEESHRRSTHKDRTGSGSSNEPLLQTESRSSERSRTDPPANTSIEPTSTIRYTQAKAVPVGRTQGVQPAHTTSIRTQRAVVHRDEAPSPPATASRRGTPKLDFWRSITPRPPSAQGERDKGKQRAASPDTTNGAGEMARLHIPQPRAPVSFLPPKVPQLQRTPPTPKKGERRESRASPRVDSFMSDSMPLPQVHQDHLTPPPANNDSALTRHPAFAQSELKHTQTSTPRPTEPKSVPAIGIQRSRSAPGTSRGRMSPCLRIPSPKFLNKDRDRSKEREREKDAQREKRRVTPESVGAPILRDARLHVPVVEKNQGPGLKTTPPKPSMAHMRRAAHGSFDFERPGSRNSSKSGQSDSRGTHTDDEKEGGKMEVQCGRKDAVPITKVTELLTLKHKASSPVPPLPTSRLKPRSPPPNRTRSPLATSPASADHSHTNSAHTDIDDSALPRLSSSLGRRNTGGSNHRTHRSQGALPAFSFEPAAPQPSSTTKATRDASVRSGLFVDPHTGLMWAPTRLKDNAIPEDGTHVHFSGGARARSPGVNGNQKTSRYYEDKTEATPSREMDEATAVIAQFRSALDDAGYATLQKYVRRYDAQIIPLEGAAGLLVRVQRLLETSAPRVDNRRKRQLLDSFIQVVSQVS
ncbi:hypothetical protein M0805_002439 [Coniferiporia weirii]|nr:hypothetical protein M0805_002439 [Coniferiporia weirii]